MKNFDYSSSLAKNDQNTNTKNFDSSLIAKIDQHISEKNSDSADSVSGHEDDGEADLDDDEKAERAELKRPKRQRKS